MPAGDDDMAGVSGSWFIFERCFWFLEGAMWYGFETEKFANCFAGSDTMFV